MFAEQFANVRTKSPLIHNITNYVTVNDCANMVLACGASPIMADDAAEVEEITAICGGLNINIGTLNSRTVTRRCRKEQFNCVERLAHIAAADRGDIPRCARFDVRRDVLTLSLIHI